MYIPHGGGPRPLLGDPEHEKLIRFLQSVPEQFPRPEAILNISAHWEAPVPSLTSGDRPGLIYDYGGFPPESYEIKYPAPGDPALAKDIASMLAAHSIPVQLDEQRGFDHGMFVPLKLMYPDADIPVIQLSILANLDAGSHIVLGKALSSIKKKNILVLGSGMSFHNLRSFYEEGLVSDEDNEAFENWLNETCTDETLDTAGREQRLINWHQAPGGLACQPRPDHLLPLHVCYGMAGTPAEVIFNDQVLGKRVSGYLWT